MDHISLCMSLSSDRLCVTMCPKYLKWETNCKSLTLSLKRGNTVPCIQFHFLGIKHTYEGRWKSSYTDTVNYEIRTSYFVSFPYRHLQLKCTWSSISPKLWYRCTRIVVPGLTPSHLPCNTNTNGEYGGWRSSSKAEFWMAASDLWSDALSWLQVTSVFS